MLGLGWELVEVACRRVDLRTSYVKVFSILGEEGERESKAQFLGLDRAGYLTLILGDIDYSKRKLPN